jgi:signal transduction histidine kinase
LKTYIQDDYIVLPVKDNGLGLNQNQQKKLFNLFARLHKDVEGTGVGLFMVKRIVENMGGRIEVKSEEGKGIAFNVYLKK